MRLFPYLYIAFLSIFLVLTGCENDDLISSDEANSGGDTEQFNSLAKVTVDKVKVIAFQPAGNFGGGVLEPGTFFPPTKQGFSTLRRSKDWISYNVHTTGLPPGAYTNWCVVINEPWNCIDGCDEADIFANPNVTNSSVFWATGGIVKSNGVGNFRAKIKVGDISDDPRQHIFGPGLVNTETSEIHIIIKYHGPVSPNPDDLWLQLNTLTGLCDGGANGYDLGEPFFIQCFDPQVAVHKP